MLETAAPITTDSPDDRVPQAVTPVSDDSWTDDADLAAGQADEADVADQNAIA